MKDITTLVIHVRDHREREAFIQHELDKQGLPCHYILEGNVTDLTADVLDEYFAGDMHGSFPATSCTYKHLLAMQYIVSHRLDGALVIEDDLRFYSRFRKVFDKSLAEYCTHYADQPFIANYEESGLLFVPRSRRRKNVVLYAAFRDRFAGCCFVSRKAAEAVLDYVKEYKTDVPIDRLHSRLIDLGIIKYYWSYPCLACQCSCDGSMPTMIPTRPRPLKRLKWFYKRAYKHLLYFLR